MSATIVWFRQDLRLQDNAALAAAIRRGGPVVPVFIWDVAGEGRWVPGAASRWWLHHSLAALDGALREHGSRLVMARGAAAEVLRRMARASGVDAVYWNRRFEPAAKAQQAEVARVLAGGGIETEQFNSALLHAPEAVANKQGGPFKVFTPFWRLCLTREIARPVKVDADAMRSPVKWPKGIELPELGLLPRENWAGDWLQRWEPGELGAAKRLRRFVSRAIEDYADDRDALGGEGTSTLSPHLHFGEVGPRQVWAAVRKASRDSGVFPPGKGASIFLSELGWREFAYHLLFHFPHTPERPLREEFAHFRWAEDPRGLKLRAWQRGQTGYPVVDAAMRQSWRTGWMHNRARMIVASFLVKHLRLPWSAGAAWFWDTLVDADLANNTLGWQWSAGCGADAAPYFRIFAPVRQGEKFDADGHYVRRWVPELAKLPAKFLHAPWAAPAEVLTDAGVRLGENYPAPIVDHASARAAALAAFRALGKMKRKP